MGFTKAQAGTGYVTQANISSAHLVLTKLNQVINNLLLLLYSIHTLQYREVQ